MLFEFSHREDSVRILAVQLRRTMVIVDSNWCAMSTPIRQLTNKRLCFTFDSTFDVLCLTFGLNNRSEYKWSLALRFVQLLWIIGHAGYAAFCAASFIRFLKAGVSCSQISMTLNNGIYFAASLLVGLRYNRRRKQFQELLQSNQRCASNTVLLFLLTTPYVLSNVYELWLSITHFTSYRLLCYSLCFTYASFIKTGILMVYMEAVAIIADQHEALAQLATTAQPMTLAVRVALTERKWKMREATRQLNSLLAVPLSLLYVQLFMLAIVAIGYTIFTHVSTLGAICLAVGHLGFGLQLFYVAHQSSALYQAYHDLESRLMQQSNQQLVLCTNSVNEEVDKALEVLRYREEWDALRLGCFGFVHNLRSFVSYLATSVTCVSVVLQFDYQVLRTIAQLAKRYGDVTSEG